MITLVALSNLFTLALLFLVLRHASSIKSAITLLHSNAMTQFSDVQNSITNVKAAVIAEVQRVAGNLTNADPSDTEAARAQAVTDLNALADQLNATDPAQADPTSGAASTGSTTQANS